MHPLRIPFYDLAAENALFAAEFHQALNRILASGQFVRGQELARFEQELARYLGVTMAWGLKSGTDALYYGMKALGIGPGDQVIAPAFTFPATIAAILRTGATPILADIHPETLCLSFAAAREMITSRTRALVLVHLFGNCAELEPFLALAQQYNLQLIEDAAQALGAEYQGKKLGSFGALAAFSFYPTKNLGALGNGGALVCPIQPCLPPSSRLDELQAAFLVLKFRHLEQTLERRRTLAQNYTSALGRYVRIVRTAPGATSNFHQFAILTPHRDRLRSFLLSRGIQTMIYYPRPVYHEPEFSMLATYPLPAAERASREILCLPIRPSLTDAEQDVIINTVVEFFSVVL